MLDSKIYFFQSEKKKQNKTPKQNKKKPNYTHIYSVNIFRALTLGNIVSLQPYDNTAYATTELQKQSHQQSYRHRDFTF